MPTLSPHRPRTLGSSLVLALAAAAALAGPRVAAAADELRAGFIDPPDAARTRTWWHWVSGNVSADGITADLEAMKRVGVGGAQMFTVDQSDVHGPIKFMSDDWRKLVHHALQDADRLGLEMSMEGCDGWSESGGPWITPAQSMQKVTWSESRVSGGAKVSLALPQPPSNRDYYEDVAILAWPTVSGDALPAPASITSNIPGFDAARLLPAGGPATTRPADDGAGAAAPATAPAGPERWVLLTFAEPVTCRSATVDAGNKVSWELQASDDGLAFRSIARGTRRETATFPATTAKFFRLWITGAKGKPPSPKVAAFALGGPRVDRFDARSGMAVDFAANTFTDAATPGGDGSAAADSIAPGAIVDLTGKTEWDAPAGEWTIVRLGHTSTGITTHPSTAAGLECDKLSRAAVEAQFAGMFGPVIADSRPLIGKTLRYVLLDSWEAGCENWTPLIREEFRNRRGYDLWPWLPVLTGRIVGSAEQSERFLWDYRRTLADLVADNHYGTFADLAHQNGMGLYAEATGIGMPTVADQLQCKGRTDVPMGEFWVNKSNEANVDDPKEAASAAHIYGRNIAACESFTSTPATAAWKNDPYSLKALGDREFCLGVNRFIFHRYAHQPWPDRKPGMTMGPWGINFERTNTWWEPGSAWLAYLSRCQYLLQQGTFVADACYFYGEGAPACVRHAELRPAPPAGFDYDVVDAGLLVDKMTVDGGRVALPGGMSYRVLVLPDDGRMTLRVLRKVASLVKAGATVYGPRPTRSPSLADYAAGDDAVRALAAEVWGDCDGKAVTEHAYGQGRVIWGEPLERAIAAPADFRSTAGDQLYIHRRTADADVYFVSNQQAATVEGQYAFRVAGKVPELWHPETGTGEAVALYRSENGVTTLPLRLDPVGSTFVVFRDAPAPAAPLASVTHDGRPLFAPGAPPSEGVAELPVVEGGVARMTAWSAGAYAFAAADGRSVSADVAPLPAPIALDDHWQLSFPPGLGAPATAALDRLTSWTESGDAGVKYFSGTATYQKDVELPADLFAANRRLYLDLGDVKNLAEVTVNGHALGVLWKAPFRVEVTSALKPGTNRLEVKVTNLWPNRLIGDQSLPPEKRITWASFDPYKATDPLLPSGLLGPVRIRAAEEIVVGK